MVAKVDIQWWRGYGFSRSRDREGPAEMNCRAAVPAVQFAGRCGGGVPKPERCRTATELTAAPGGQQSSGAATSSTAVHAVAVPAVRLSAVPPVKASAAGARTGKCGSGVPSQSRCRTGDGAGCRRVALFQVTRSSQYQPAVRSSRLVSDRFRGKNGGARRHQDRPDGRRESGYRRTSIVRWSPVKQLRSPHPRRYSGRVGGNRRPAHYQGRQMV
jgi:hypothetical protein